MYRKKLLIDLTAAFLIVLFLYTAITKLYTITGFTYTLSKMPLIESLARNLAYGVPLVEIAVALLMVFPQSRYAGLWCALLLMSLFTLYLGVSLIYFSDLPCSCGGIIGAMSWKQHLFFNLGTVAITGLSIYRYKKNIILLRNQPKPKSCERVGNNQSFKFSSMKKYLLGLIAIVMAISASAFTLINQDVWYVFTSQDLGDITDRTKYQNTGLSESPGCGSTGDICAIKLPDSGSNHPVTNDFQQLVQDIEDSQDQNLSTTSAIEMEE